MIQNYRQQLLKITGYNFWANKRILALIKSLDNDLLEKEIISSFSSLKKTLIHTWDAETIWYERLMGNPVKDWPGKNFSGNIIELTKGIITSSENLAEFIKSLPDEKVTSIINYSNLKGENFSTSLIDMVTHCVNHSTYHRGQIITMLRQAGKTDLISTDYIIYLRK